MRAAVIVFPGSNCDRDALTTIQSMLDGAWGDAVSGSVKKVWHRDTTLPDVDLVMLPGGFSYGDYLRSGAMSARSPIMREVARHAEKGGYVLGVCNGFQVLTETGLLPGALMRNRDLRFICKTVPLRVEHNKSVFTTRYSESEVIHVPVAHHDGNYRADSDTLKALEDDQQVLFRYADDNGAVTDAANINGSVNNIAGLTNKAGNILGMMPHPERICDVQTTGYDYGRGVFLSAADHIAAA